jgi:hypothetical protein
MSKYTKNWKRNEEEKLKEELSYLHSVTPVGHDLMENHCLDMEQLEELKQ